MKMYIAKIAIIKPLYNLFDYDITDKYNYIEPGCRVLVEFRKKIVVGFVISLSFSEKPLNYKLKSIIELIDKQPILDNETLNLIKWVANYYHAPLGQVIGIGTPLYIRQGKKLLEEISENKKIQIIEKKKIKLTEEQNNAVNIIKESLDNYKCYVLDGVTGSGKTEVYKKIQYLVYTKGLQTLIIVPEKNLIPELLRYFNSEKIRAIEYHSSLTPKQKFINWDLIQKLKIDIIIGTRSSVFLQIPKLGLIIVDEEHDLSFKNSSDVKYNARDISIFRAKKKNIPIILGSATPSSETTLNILKKKYFHIKMRSRVNKQKLPLLKIINMSNKKNEIISNEVIKEIKNQIEKKEQTLIFLNRRGYSPIIFCKDCMWIPKSNICNLNMTYHKNSNLLMCHYSGESIKFQNKCHSCNSTNIAFIGEGTEKIEELIKSNFINAKIIRIDSDNMKKKGKLEEVFSEIKNNKYDIIIGTQMLSKGHNFPNITLVVIMNIDQNLFSPRLKSIEQLAQQLIQVSGRSGRGNTPGKVIMQTAFPNNEDLNFLIKYGYEKWLSNLLILRNNLSLPPFKNWGIFEAKSKKKMMQKYF